MYGGKLYILSPDKVGTYKFENNENLILVGTINDSIDGTKFAEKDMQVSGNADLVKCDVFTSEEFPDYIFVYNNGNYVAFIKN